MRKNLFVLVFSLLFFSGGCKVSKSFSHKDLYPSTWELEYISGSENEFDDLFPDKKPQMTFFESENKVSGNTGCNGFNTSFTVEGQSIKFKLPAAMTMRYCDGGGEQIFLKAMGKVNAFAIDNDDKLNLMFNGVPLLRLKKMN